MKIIINKGKDTSTINEKIVRTSDAISLINKNLKINKAKLIIDTETTLAYNITN